MQGTIGVLTFTDGSHAVTFYPTTMVAGSVPFYKAQDLKTLKQFFSSINVTLTQEQLEQLHPTKGLSIHNLNPPDDVLKRYRLIK